MAIATPCSPSLWSSRRIFPPRKVRASVSVDSSPNSRESAGGSVVVRSASGESELSAAAFLRARSFYCYPEGRSIEAQEAHQKYMASLEFKILCSKVAGNEPGFGRVACLVALLPLETMSSIPDDFSKSCKVTVSGEELLVVGTLDLNQGRQIPGEIPGSRPKDLDPKYKRAYISNFCVAREARRKGIGTALVDEAKRRAKEWGVTDLYVHVVITNDPAYGLYSKAGFVRETEETLASSHLLDRPRRKLLWFGSL